MSKNTCTAVNAPAYLECQICLDSWLNPVQLDSCGHIFCAHCITRNMTKCFLCGSTITGTHTPSDYICSEADKVPVVCSSCGWRGTRKASKSHRCNSKEVHTQYEMYPERTDTQWIEFIKGATQPSTNTNTNTISSSSTVHAIVRYENDSDDEGECKKQTEVCNGIVL